MDDRSRGASSTPTVRCVIYTRKSTEEGLDRDFNSLDAQREAAEAYIKSQRHLGWTLVPYRYDDGGFGGGTLERPALQKLLSDLEARRFDCVIVYKVDRLSRSLLDFARLIDRFDQQSISFVSVTQQFNTTNSLGRLTLNILLSFAQFEREIISERTRDKMSAARRKGKWVGGIPVLGYDIDPAGRRLVPNEKEGRQVREIFALYKRHRALGPVVEELARRRWTLKSWETKSGDKHGGTGFTKNSLRRLLTNAVYAGKVEHRGTVYPGEHTATIDPSLLDEFRSELRATRPKAKSTPQNALLAGLLFCKSCQRPMVATYTAKRGRRFRYYVCQTARQKGWSACPTKAVPASMIEEAVREQIRIALGSDSIPTDCDVSETEQKVSKPDDDESMRSLIKGVSYDGPTGAVSLQLISGRLANAD